MVKKYILVSIEDERAKKIASVLGNKTCKKIIDVLAEKESSEKEIADELKIPMNTAEYNLKKLLDAGLVEKTKNFFWSKKGRKIDIYKVSNKSIVISPKSSDMVSKIKSFAIVLGASGLIALFIKKFYNPEIKEKKFFAESVSTLASEGIAHQEVWTWFLGGALFALLLFAIIKWRKI